MSETYIRLKNIRKTYGTTVIIDIDKAEIPLNTVVAVVGYSGVGKSTLINIISLLDLPDYVYFDGDKKLSPRITIQFTDTCIEVTYKKKFRFDISLKQNNAEPRKLTVTEARSAYFGYVFQDAHLHPNFNLIDNIKTPLLIRKAMVGKELNELLTTSGLSEHQYKYVDELSGGQQQRTAILRGLIKRSPILVGDELTNNLDGERSKQLLTLLERIVAENNGSLIWVTHDIHLASEFAEKIVIIKDKRIRIHDNPQKPDEILLLLQRGGKPAVQEIPELGSGERKASWSEMVRYYTTYAISDLFRRYKPSADFVLNFFSITLILIFLLSLTKIGISTQQFLEAKLSDPRINNLKITPSGMLADNQLNLEDMEILSEIIGEERIRHIAPVYKTTIDFVRQRDHKHVRLPKPAITFERGDKIVNSFAPSEASGFINDSVSYDGILIFQKAFRRLLPRLELADIPDTITIAVNRITREVPLFITSSPLPDNRHAMMRSELYLNAYHGEKPGDNPALEYILIYPEDIHYTIPIIEELNKPELKGGKEYSVDSALDVNKKIEVITEIEQLVGGVVRWALLAIAILAVSFVALTIYRSIYRKRKEIGVLCAFGMKKWSFVWFYLIEAALLWATTAVASYAVFYYWIAPKVNQIVLNSEQLNNLPKELQITVDSSALALPLPLILMYYFITLLLLGSIFTGLIFKFTRRLPVNLIKET